MSKFNFKYSDVEQSLEEAAIVVISQEYLQNKINDLDKVLWIEKQIKDQDNEISTFLLMCMVNGIFKEVTRE